MQLDLISVYLTVSVLLVLRGGEKGLKGEENDAKTNLGQGERETVQLNRRKSAKRLTAERPIMQIFHLNKYSVVHPLVVDVLCALSWTQSESMVLKQDTQNIYHEQIINGV